MNTWSKAIGKFIRQHLKNRLLGGVLVLVPAAATFLILRFIFNWLDGLLQPVIQHFWGRTFPGVGLIGLVILLYLAGIFAGTYLGRWTFSWAQKLVLRIPVVQTIYSAFKGVTDSFARVGETPFQRPVLVQYPRLGMWTMGFLTAGPVTTPVGERFAVYLPSTPTPTTGYVFFVTSEDIIPTELTVEEALRIIISGGILSPKKM